MLSEKTKCAILELQKEYPEKRSALIPALHLAQDEVGYLPLDVQEEIATLFDIDATEVHGIVTFYDMFFTHRVGKHIIHVCKNVSCMLNGCDRLIEKLEKTLGIEDGMTTPDGKFTLITTECLAACDKAPMILLDEHVIGPVSDSDIEKILKGVEHD